MKFQNLSVALMLAAGLAVGCEEAKDAATGAADATKDAANTAAESTGDAMDSLKTQASEAGEAMKEAGADAVEATKEKTEEIVEATQETVDDVVESGKDKLNELTGNSQNAVEEAAESAETPASDAAGAAESAAEDAAGGLTLDSLKEGMSLDGSQVDGIIEKVKGLIGEKNYDSAQQWISKLEGMQLPEGYADKVSGLKSLLEKAQGAGDMLNGIGG